MKQATLAFQRPISVKNNHIPTVYPPQCGDSWCLNGPPTIVDSLTGSVTVCETYAVCDVCCNFNVRLGTASTDTSRPGSASTDTSRQGSAATNTSSNNRRMIAIKEFATWGPQYAKMRLNQLSKV